MEVQEKRSQENGPKAEKDKTDRATRLGRKTKEEIYVTGGGRKAKHQTLRVNDDQKTAHWEQTNNSLVVPVNHHKQVKITS